jgi:hypothetical protein
MEVEPNGRVLAEDCRVDVFVTNEGGATRWGHSFCWKSLLLKSRCSCGHLLSIFLGVCRSFFLNKLGKLTLILRVHHYMTVMSRAK